jgi:Na+-transporting methylmalonyl-CoA/oxaloacetate decarboxylase gamma subunit
MATYGTYNSPGPIKIAFYGIGILFAFLIMFYVVRGMYREENRGPVNAARAEQRIKARKDLEAKNAALLNTAGWVDSNKAIVRLPIARAMELTVDGYRNPGAAHSNLVARSQKAAEPAPAAPEQPSQFE